MHTERTIVMIIRIGFILFFTKTMLALLSGFIKNFSLPVVIIHVRQKYFAMDILSLKIRILQDWCLQKI